MVTTSSFLGTSSKDNEDCVLCVGFLLLWGKLDVTMKFNKKPWLDQIIKAPALGGARTTHIRWLQDAMFYSNCTV